MPNPLAQTQTETLADRTLLITRVFDAPRDLVYQMWTRKEHMDKWCLPSGFTHVESQVDLRPGGVWRNVMAAPDGELFPEGGVYREIVPGERLVFTHAWEGDDGKPEHETLVEIQFADEAGGKTRMNFKQAVMRSMESRDNHRGGWSETFDALDAYLPGVTGRTA